MNKENYPVVKKNSSNFLFHWRDYWKIIHHEGFSIMDESVG
jgi:hypothetical protein